MGGLEAIGATSSRQMLCAVESGWWRRLKRSGRKKSVAYRSIYYGIHSCYQDVWNSARVAHHYILEQEEAASEGRMDPSETYQIDSDDFDSGDEDEDDVIVDEEFSRMLEEGAELGPRR